MQLKLVPLQQGHQLVVPAEYGEGAVVLLQQQPGQQPDSVQYVPVGVGVVGTDSNNIMGLSTQAQHYD